MKILVIKFLNIGDVLLTTPLIDNLKYYYPDAVIDMALIKGTEDMITMNPSINKIHIFDRDGLRSGSKWNRVLGEWRYAKKIKDEKYDIAIQTTRGDRGLNLAIFSGAKTIISYPAKDGRVLDRLITYKLPKIGNKHMIDANLDPIRVLGKEPVSKRVSIYWSQKDEEKVKEILKKYNLKEKHFIHFHPVSRWMFKCISDYTAAKVIDYCQNELNTPVVITSAPVKKELEKIQSIISLCKSKPIDISGELSLKETSALNSKAKLFTGVDTAIMHISAANDIPVVAMFGPSAVYHWGPWDNSINKSSYKAKKGVQKMGRHKVLQLDWECIPCGIDGCNGTKVSDCLIQMPLNLIQQSIKESLESIE